MRGLRCTPTFICDGLGWTLAVSAEWENSWAYGHWVTHPLTYLLCR